MYSPTDLYLQLSSVKTPTWTRYSSALRDFLLWASLSGIQDPSSFHDFDAILSDYIHAMYRSNPRRGCRSRCSNLLSAILFFFPSIRGSLGLSARALSGWDRLVPSTSPTPFTLNTAMLLAATLFCMGHDRSACAVLLGFDTLARPGELFSLSPSSVALPGDPRLSGSVLPGSAAVFLPQAKTGSLQAIWFSHPLGIAALRYLVASPVSVSSVVGVPIRTFRVQFKAALALCSLNGLGLRPHSLRHGGAVFLYNSGVSVEDISVRGRWASMKSLRRYLQTGRAILVDSALPPVASLLLGDPLSFASRELSFLNAFLPVGV